MSKWRPARQQRRISLSNLSDSSFKEIFERPAEKNWYSYVVPGISWYYDIPDLVELVGKEKISFKD